MYSISQLKMSTKVSDYNYHKMKPVDKRTFRKETIYLDLIMYPGEANLSKNLKLLGAKMEPVFSDRVSLVVTNRGSARNAHARPFKIPPKPQDWTPLTPITNTTSHSPLFRHESSAEYMDSPSYMNSPATDQNAVHPLCRGMAMVKQAILKKQSQGSTDILEMCRQLKVKVEHVDDILQKVKKLSPYIAQFDVEKKISQNRERKLKPPFLKVEESKRRGLWYQEFPSSTFDNKLADKVKELYNHFKKSGNIQVAIKPAQGEFNKNKCFPMSSMLYTAAHTPSLSKSISKFSETPKPSTAFSICNVKRKISDHAPVPSKKQKTAQGKKKKLYCEICKTNYVHLDKHLASENHRIFMSDPMNFLEIQNIILSLPQKEDFLSSRWSLSSDVGQISNETQLSSCQVLESSGILQVYPQDYPNTCEVLDNEFNPQQFESKEIVPAGLDLDTEPYSVIDQFYVSPSCTSPYSTYLPYLEDTYDNIINGFTKGNDICDTPLNLSNDGNRNFDNNCNQSPNFKCPENVSLQEYAVETINATLREDLNFHSPCMANEATSVTEDMLTVANKREMEEGNLNSIPPVGNPSFLKDFGKEVLQKDVKEGKTSEKVSTVVGHSQNYCTQYFQCIDCTQENFFRHSKVNLALPEGKFFENPSFQETTQNTSNDSGISIRDSPPPELTLHGSPVKETDAAVLKIDECCALDLSTTKNLDIAIVSNTEAQDSTSSCNEKCSMPELSKVMVDTVAVTDQDSEMSDGVPMPPLLPVVRECETNAVIIGTFGNPGDLEMPDIVHEMECEENIVHEMEGEENIVHEMECEASLQDTSQTTIVACKQVPFDTINIPNESSVAVGSTEHAEISKDLHRTEHKDSEYNAKSPTEIACEPVPNEDINQDICSTNVFEAVAVDVGTFGDCTAQNILHESEYETSLKNASPFIHESSFENQTIENMDILNKIENEAVTQNSDSSTDVVCLHISIEGKNIQQEAICSKNVSEADTSDIGTFGNSRCLDTPNVADECQLDNTPNTSSPTNVPIYIEPQNNQNEVICSSNAGKSEFVQLCEEVSKSFNCIGADLSSSEVSCYELVEEAESDSDSECEWDCIHSEMDNLCVCLCISENEDTDPFTMGC